MSLGIERLLESYPRERPPLPESYKRIYEQEYVLNRSGGSLANRLSLRAESWMHRMIAQRASPGAVLEIGGGTLNHLPYEPAVDHYDVIEPFEALYANSSNRARVRTIYRQMADVPESARYARIISVAVLEHLENLPQVIARSALLLSRNGLSQHSIPSEGGFLWGLGWRMTTGLAYRIRNGLSYGVAMRHEHINDAREIIAVIGWFYARVKMRRFPGPSHHTSLYTYVEATAPRHDRCREYLGNRRSHHDESDGDATSVARAPIKSDRILSRG